MTQEELAKQIEYLCEFKPYDEAAQEIVKLVNQYVAEVIGEDEGYSPRSAPACYTRNNLRAEQRKRAGL